MNLKIEFLGIIFALLLSFVASACVSGGGKCVCTEIDAANAAANVALCE